MEFTVIVAVAYGKVDGIFGGFANNLGIKERDFQISDKGIDQNNSDRTRVSVGTDFGGYGSDLYRKNGNDFAPQKKEKIKHQMLTTED
ncbi:MULTISPECIES: hypothetical protein [Bartonella]|uniref:hypothetical protein n=1 Tax=Bartonella TaxID=773 RepID=UPI0018DEBF05|nr:MULTISPECIES: hypothetical protein [Bartonella]MBH9994248.1 hypothetical protein [Bartonella sp. P0291]MBH9997407.1 hypothetical protein [Bartonella sp. M0192]MBH9999567.1 hypothetical protein [Bartonella sp. M0191]MBI0009114.1 hypothetical protein [Bartonella sp. M0193]MBI0010858.1 hypothetical protein [Bartonella sp. M0176]